MKDKDAVKELLKKTKRDLERLNKMENLQNEMESGCLIGELYSEMISKIHVRKILLKDMIRHFEKTLYREDEER